MLRKTKTKAEPVKKKVTPKLDLSAFELYPLQQEMADYIDGNKFNAVGEPYLYFVCILGRQSGKSYLLKKVALDHAINKGEKVLWVSPSQPTSRSHWNDIVAIIEETGFPVMKMSHQNREILFFGGGSITLRSAIRPDNLRGGSIDLMLLDEAAFFSGGNYIWQQILLPMLSATKGKCVIATTPNGRNYVYNLFKKGNNPKNLFYKSFHAPTSVSPYQTPAVLQEIRESVPEIAWRQEFLAEFLADAGGVFAKVDKASVVKMLDGPIEGHTYSCGIDIASVNDESCITFVDDMTREQVYGESWTGIGTIPSIARIGRLLDLWKPRLTMFEKNGIGETFFDIAKHYLGGREADPDLLDRIAEFESEYSSSGLEDIEYNESDDEDQYQPEQVEVDEYEEVEHLPTMPRKTGTRYVDNPRISEYDASVGGHRIRAIHMNNERKRQAVDELSVAIEFGRFFLLDRNTDYGEKQNSQLSTFERVPTAKGMSITYKAQSGANDDCVSALYLAHRAMPKIARPKTNKDQNTFSKGRGNPLRSSYNGTPWYSRKT